MGMPIGSTDFKEDDNEFEKNMVAWNIEVVSKKQSVVSPDTILYFLGHAKFRCW